MLSFNVRPGVLVPRPETEALVDIVVNWVHGHGLTRPQIVDVGTGSGVIAVSLAVRLPSAGMIATDISAAALGVARENAVEHGVYEQIAFVQTDLLAGLAGPFDVIAANLPYIAHDELEELDVARWEPRDALDGGTDGLELIRRLVAEARGRFEEKGLLVLEFGYAQGAAVMAICQQAFPGMQVTIHPDLAGMDRLVTVEVKGPL
jgi:release factor glutamine methyltransferase